MSDAVADEQWVLIEDGDKNFWVSSHGRVRTKKTNGQFGEPYRPRRYQTRSPRVNSKPLAKMVYKTFCNPSNSELAMLDWSEYRVEPKDGDWNNLKASNLKFVPFVPKANATTFMPGQQPPPHGNQIVSVDVRDGTVRRFATQSACKDHFECHPNHLRAVLKREEPVREHFKLFHAFKHSQILNAESRGRANATIMKLDIIPEDFESGPGGDTFSPERWFDHRNVRSLYKLQPMQDVEMRLKNEAHMLDAVERSASDFNAPPPRSPEPQPIDKFCIEPNYNEDLVDGTRIQNRWATRRYCAVGDGAAAGTYTWTLRVGSDVSTLKDVFVGVTAAVSALRPGKTIGVNVFGTIVEGDHPWAPSTLRARATTVKCCVPETFVQVTFVGSEKLVRFALLCKDDVLWEVEERISISRPRIWASVYRLHDVVRIM